MQALALDIPSAPGEQGVTCDREAGHVRHLRPGDEGKAGRGRQAEQLLEPAAADLFDHRLGGATRMDRRLRKLQLEFAQEPLGELVAVRMRRDREPIDPSHCCSYAAKRYADHLAVRIEPLVHFQPVRPLDQRVRLADGVIVKVWPHLTGDLERIPWKGAAHITGGGILGNLPRSLPDGVAAQLDRSAWNVPPIFDLIRERGRIADDEMFATFNMGLGMILVVAREAVPPGALVVGQLTRQTGPDRVRIN